MKKFLVNVATKVKSFVKREQLLPALLVILALYLFLPRYQLAAVQDSDGREHLYTIDMRTKDIKRVNQFKLRYN